MAADRPGEDWRYEYIDDPRCVGEGQEPPRSPLVPYADARAAARRDVASSDWIRSLDGEWHFRWVMRPSDEPTSIAGPDRDVSGWGKIRVPSVWQTEGYDRPIYRNVVMPFWPYDDVAYTVPKDLNPVGTYVRTFDLRRAWIGRRTLLRFEGVQSGFFVWINGEYAGYDQGGMTPAEFDVTRLVTAGENRIAVQVFRWSAGSYLENFDYWHLAGIYRSVTLLSVPQTHIRDLHVVTTLGDECQNATLQLQIEARTATREPAREVPLRTTLLDATGAIVDHIETMLPISDGTGRVALERAVSSPRLWSDEDPYLYTLVVELGDRDETHVTAERVGLRAWRIRDSILHLNGKPIVIRGVNRHEHDPRTGRTMTEALMRADLELMRQFNINAVRTSHYPNDPLFCELADEYGILVCGEVDIETHARLVGPNRPATRPEWREAFLDRARAMVQRDKNRPCVFMWSTGNEAGTGRHHLAMAALIRDIDPTRPLFHQPEAEGVEGDAPWAHVHGPRYPEFETARGYLHTAVKPVVFGEYMHAMGNSLGGFRDLWEIIRAYPSGQGGFIWDWVDQALVQDLIAVADGSHNRIGTHVNGRPSLTDGMHGPALQLSGLDDWIEVAPDPALDITGQELTLDIWVKPGDYVAPGSGHFLSKGNTHYGLQLHDANDQDVDDAEQMAVRHAHFPQHPRQALRRAPRRVEFYLHNGKRRTLTAPLPANWVDHWHRLTGTYDGATMRLYIDGVLSGSMPTRGPLTHTPDNVFIGRNPGLVGENTPARTSNAAIDRVRIYARALPEQVIASGGDPADDAALALDPGTCQTVGTYESYGTSAFLLNGVVFADRTPKPGLYQVKHTHAPIRFVATDARAGRITVTNEHHTIDLSAYDFTWKLRANGEVAREGTFQVDGAPGSTVDIQIHWDTAVPDAADAEWHLEVHAHRRDPGPGTAAGHEVSWAQWVVQQPTPTLPDPRTTRPPASVAQSATDIVVRGTDWRYAFDKSTGTIASMRWRDRELLTHGPRLNVWRDPTGNDDAQRMGRQWRQIGLDRLHHKVRNVRVSGRPGDTVLIEIDTFAATLADAGGFANTYVYEIDSSGVIVLRHAVVPEGDRLRNLAWLPRIGLELGVPADFQRFTWYGRGPIETEPDRVDGALVAVHTGTVEGQHVPYNPPQHNGLKVDTRWAELASNDHRGLVIEGHPTFNIEVTNYRNRDRAAYPHHLNRAPHVRVMIDHRTTGVGETFQTGIHPSYRTSPSASYTYQLTLRPSTSASPPRRAGGLPHESIRQQRLRKSAQPTSAAAQSDREGPL